MRSLLVIAILIVAGCGPSTAVSDEPVQLLGTKPTTPVEVPDLRTRKTGDDWPCFLGSSGESKSTEKGILTEWPIEGPPLVWEIKLGMGYGMPSISQGRLFLFDREDENARLRCLNSETGNFIWKFEYPTNYEDHFGYNNGPRCCPVIDGDRVYIYGVEGMLHCLRVTDGKLLWKIDTKAKYKFVDNFFGVASTPVIDGDRLIVMVGGSPAESQGLDIMQLNQIQGNGTGIVVFDKYTGNVKYEVSDELAAYTSPKLTTIDGRPWCFAFMRGGLLGFNPQTGKVDFHYPWKAKILESVNASDPVVVGSEVFISETYGPGSSLLKVRDSGYDVVWKDDSKVRHRALKMHWNTPIYVDGYLYGSSGRHEGTAEFRCVEWKTGKVVWREKRLGRMSLLLVEGHLVALGERGILRLIKVNSEKYELLAETALVKGNPQTTFPKLSHPAWAAPILSNGLLYVRGRKTLVCLELIPEKK